MEILAWIIIGILTMIMITQLSIYGKITDIIKKWGPKTDLNNHQAKDNRHGLPWDTTEKE